MLDKVVGKPQTRSRPSRGIPICMCFDRNYADYAAVAAYSAFKNSRSPLKFYWLCTKDSGAYAEELAFKLQSIGMDVNPLAVAMEEIGAWKTSHHFTTAAYLRLMAPDLLPDEDRVIYLDCDILILCDLAALYGIDMEDLNIAGVPDKGGAVTSPIPRENGDQYINSGVMVMELNRLREENFFEACKEIYYKYKDHIIWIDQCLINKSQEGRKLIIDSRYNRQIFSNSISGKQFNELVADGGSSVLHFVGSIKPWQAWCNPYVAGFWWRYANDLAIGGLVPTPITSVEQLIALANVSHVNGSYEDASNIKSKVINLLFKHLKASSADR